MNDQQLLRYSRHILLQEIDIAGQQRLLDAHAIIIGIGGLGSPAALYLAASGVGRLTLCDGDTVELSNLQRQIIHPTSRIGQTKVDSARATLQDINPEVECIALAERLGPERLQALIDGADVVLDCSDNFDTRYAVNRACLAARKPLVSGAAVQFHGQISVFDFRHDTGPCYHCLFPETLQAAELRCATTGVFAPLVGIVGTLQAAETLKLLLGIGQSLDGRLINFDARDMQFLQTRVHKDPACPVCQERTPANAATGGKT